jgi:hypothetical protein
MIFVRTCAGCCDWKASLAAKAALGGRRQPHSFYRTAPGSVCYLTVCCLFYILVGLCQKKKS